MIFDPALAAAARRHQRAQNKVNKSPTPGGVPTSPADNNNNNRNNNVSSSTSTDSTKVPLPIDDAAAAAAADTTPPSTSSDSSAAKDLVTGEKARSTSSSSGDAGSSSGGAAAAAVALGGTASSSNSNGVDFEGATARARAGGGASRQRQMKPRVLLKIVVLGCSNVGKTSLMKRYAAGDFTDYRRPTIGADFMTKEVVEGDQPMLLQIWDTAGQERFHGGSLGSGFFRGANAALLVYDVACAVSFEQVAMWREELLVRLDVDPHDFPIVVIGNKVDLAAGLAMDGIHGVDKTRVMKWCEMQGMGHIETSAKDGTGVEVAMQAVAVLALEQKRKRERDLALNPSLGGGTTLDLADQRARQQRTGGCCW
ncbi:unnamed protein product [Ectocarpus sp. 8 AP-2014]